MPGSVIPGRVGPGSCWVPFPPLPVIYVLTCIIRHLISGTNFLFHYVSLVLINLLHLHSLYYLHCHHPSHLHCFILSQKTFPKNLFDYRHTHIPINQADFTDFWLFLFFSCSTVSVLVVILFIFSLWCHAVASNPTVTN